MSQTCSGGSVGDTTRRTAAALNSANWLYLAAAPTFAVMAVLTAVLGGGSPDALCSTTYVSHLGGMAAMYLLMSAFHLPPWLKLISSRRSGICPP